MNFHVADSRAKLARTELLVVFHHERAKPELPAGVEVHATALGDLRGEFREWRLADALAGAAKRVLFVGLGKHSEISVERLRRAAAIGVQRADALGAAQATLWCDRELARGVGGEEAAGEALAEGAIM